MRKNIARYIAKELKNLEQKKQEGLKANFCHVTEILFLLINPINL